MYGTFNAYVKYSTYIHVHNNRVRDYYPGGDHLFCIYPNKFIAVRCRSSRLRIRYSGNATPDRGILYVFTLSNAFLYFIFFITDGWSGPVQWSGGGSDLSVFETSAATMHNLRRLYMTSWQL